MQGVSLGVVCRPWRAHRAQKRAGLGCVRPLCAASGSRGTPRDLSHAAHALGQEPSRDSGSDSEGQDRKGSVSGKLVASMGVVGGLVLLAGGGYMLKDQIRGFLVRGT